LHAPAAIADSYVVRALAIAGWTPWLRSCVVCGRTQGLGYYSVRSGGAMCDADRTPDAMRLGDGDLETLAALVDGDWTVLDQGDVGQAVRRFVEEWGEFYLERPIRSLRLLDS
jgi:DNA repair protein RecO (recombination protein O)